MGSVAAVTESEKAHTPTPRKGSVSLGYAACFTCGKTIKVTGGHLGGTQVLHWRHWRHNKK
jgi:predicted transcriptional regulator